MDKLALAVLAAAALAPAAGHAGQKPATGWTFESRPTEEISCRLTAPGTAQEGILRQALTVTYAEGYLTFAFRGARDAFLFFPGESPAAIPGEPQAGEFVSLVSVGRELAVLKDIQGAKALFTMTGAVYFVDMTPEGREAFRKMRQCVRGRVGA